MFHSHTRTRSQFAVLPPAGFHAPRAFERAELDNHRHSRLLAAMQRLRGKVYLEDGAIRPHDLTPDGRHVHESDPRCWHVLALDPSGAVTSCLRYLDEGRAPHFRHLWVSHAALARCPKFGWKLRLAIESGRDRARSQRLGFGSVGGWAVDHERRGTLEPLAIILAMYGLLELLGGSSGVATATFRHHSASILRRIGLAPLNWSGEDLPPYFDPRYGCEMEILQFDSRRPNPRYRDAVAEFSAALALSPIICHDAAPAPQAMAAVA